MAATTSPATTPLRLTRGRRAALAVGVPVCLALVGSTGLSLVANFAEGSYPVSYTAPATTKALTLNMDGRLTITSTTASRATLTGTARYTFIRPALTEHAADGDTAVGYDCTIPVGNCELDAAVTIPATVTTLTAHSGSGDATVTGTTGPVTLSTGDGNLNIGHASGPLTLNTDSGNIQVSAITSATLSASSGQGDIRATGVTSATITANTDSGSIDGSGITTTAITASSGNGDIYITFAGAPPRDIRVNTDSGNIVLLLPPGSTKYDVKANTDNGSVSKQLPQAASSDHVITASTGNGNITISQQ